MSPAAPVHCHQYIAWTLSSARWWCWSSSPEERCVREQVGPEGEALEAFRQLPPQCSCDRAQPGQ